MSKFLNVPVNVSLAGEVLTVILSGCGGPAEKQADHSRDAATAEAVSSSPAADATERASADSGSADEPTSAAASSSLTASASPSVSKAAAPKPEKPKPLGPNEVTGVVKVFTAPELARYQKLPGGVPNNEPASFKYAVFLFDRTYQVTAATVDGYNETRPATMIPLGEKTSYSNRPAGFDLVGERMTVKLHDCHWPSDASLPLGAPRCKYTRLK